MNKPDYLFLGIIIGLVASMLVVFLVSPATKPSDTEHCQNGVGREISCDQLHDHEDITALRADLNRLVELLPLKERCRYEYPAGITYLTTTINQKDGSIPNEPEECLPYLARSPVIPAHYLIP